MIAIQIFGLFIALGALYLSYIYYKRRSFSKRELIFWLLVWLAFVTVTLFPRIVQPLVGVLGLQRPMDLIMISAFVILFGVTFYNYIVNHRLEKQIEKLVRKIALDNLDREQR